MASEGQARRSTLDVFGAKFLVVTFLRVSVSEIDSKLVHSLSRSLESEHLPRSHDIHPAFNGNLSLHFF